MFFWASQVALVVKNPPANAGDVRDLGSIPGSGRSPGGGHGNPLQYSCLVAKSRTPLKRLSASYAYVYTHTFILLFAKYKYFTWNSDITFDLCDH